MLDLGRRMALHALGQLSRWSQRRPPFERVDRVKVGIVRLLAGAAARTAAGGSRPANRRARGTAVPRRSFHRSLFQRRSLRLRVAGAGPAAHSRRRCSSPRSNTRAMRARASGSSSLESSGSTLAGSSASFMIHWAGVLEGRHGEVGGNAEPLGHARSRRAPARPGRAASGGCSMASRDGSRQTGWPSLRQYSAKVQRGRLSPGYHLPCP